MAKGFVYSVPVYSGYLGNGASFTQAPTDDNYGLTAWGDLQLTFNGCNRATATLIGRDGTMYFDLVKLVNIKGNNCVD